MKRLFIFWVILLPALTQHVHAQYYSVNYDARTVAKASGWSKLVCLRISKGMDD